MIMMKALAVSAILLAHSVAAAVPTFDYIIVGGGTAGLVLANRLSALSHVRVAIIEPGGDERGNVNVTSVNSFPNGYNSPVDWNYTSVAQANAGGRVLDYHAGKAIGGTSTINGVSTPPIFCSCDETFRQV
jgi:choline dehydrogenase